MEYCVILNTTSSLEEAKKIAHELVTIKLAACVNIIPKIISVYSWKNDIYEEEEFLLFIKTKKQNFEIVKEKIKSIHSYELPEIIMLNIKDGLQEYLNWIDKETI